MYLDRLEFCSFIVYNIKYLAPPSSQNVKLWTKRGLKVYSSIINQQTYFFLTPDKTYDYCKFKV